MNIKTNQRLWIFGDSFAMALHASLSWQTLLRNKFVGKDVIVTGRGGRDIQTIIDLFLKSLHLINDDDYVIIIIPTSSRVRYPLNEAVFELELDSRYLTIDGLDNSMADGFTAYYPFISDHKEIKSKLMFPLNIMDDDMIEDVGENTRGREPYYGEVEIKNFLKKKSKLSYSEMCTFINTSKTVLENYNNQFYSFSKTFKFDINFLSWCNDFEIFDDSVVICNNQIERDAGKLQTQHELYIESDGKYGKHGDLHWSELGNKKFSEYIIKNNSKYFN
jgi:hypothetical protein